MSLLSLLTCSCRQRRPSKQEDVDTPEVQKESDSHALVQETLEHKQPTIEKSSASQPKKEERICPVTGAVGYCPMAKPKGGRNMEDLPELKVLMLLVWEKDGSKVTVGTYPHMTKHWATLGLPDTSTKEEIKTQFRKLSIQYHPDKNHAEGAKERFQEISEAYAALQNVDGELAFNWDKYPERQQTMTGPEALRTFGPLCKECFGTDPIKAQMMQHVVKEANDCKILLYKRETTEDIVHTTEVWAEALCTDTRNGSNHLVKVYRRIVSPVHDDGAPDDGASDSTRAPSTVEQD